jgi:NAD(P)-dependent dehydrogenase (short-subunit alcohol dehydrogenase family)
VEKKEGFNVAVIELKGKVALVTGSARRVGKAVALELARQGMHQVIHHHDSDDEANQTAEEVRALGVEALVVKADQRRLVEVQGLFEAVRGHFGRLDVLVNSASDFKRTSILDISLEDWQGTLDLNLTGPFLCCQQAARLMHEGEGGSITNILDITALKASKTYAAHSVSKAALLALTLTLAKALAPQIRVNAIAPGPILRDKGYSPEEWEQLGKRLPLGHTGDPSDVAQAVVYLASQTFVTGVTLPVDGGDFLK